MPRVKSASVSKLRAERSGRRASGTKVRHVDDVRSAWPPRIATGRSVKRWSDRGRRRNLAPDPHTNQLGRGPKIAGRVRMRGRRQEKRHDFITLSRIWVTGVALVAVLLSGSLAAVHAIATPAQTTARAHAHVSADDVVDPATEHSECEHHDDDDECSPCPACSGALASSPVVSSDPPSASSSEYRAQLEQFVPLRELPPPRSA